MVTQHIENIARRTFFNALSSLFISPDAPGTVAALHDGLVAADAFATELGVDAAAFTRAADAVWPD